MSASSGGRPRPRSAWLGVALLLGPGCATTRVPRAEVAAELERRGVPPGDGRLTLGVARREGDVVYPYLVTSQEARDLRILGPAVEWTEAASGAPRREPLQAVAWLEWRAPGSRVVAALAGGGLGLTAGVALGVGLTAVTARGQCDLVPGPPLGVGGRSCYPRWGQQLTQWGLVGAAAGLALGAGLGWLLGQLTRLELFDPPPR